MVFARASAYPTRMHGLTDHPMRDHAHWPAGRVSQRGAVLILTAAFMMTALLSLALVIDSGRLYVKKRDLQRLADLSAQESASRQACTAGHDATQLARSSATRNAFITTNRTDRRVSAECGEVVLDQGVRRFQSNAASTQAIRVTVEEDVAASLIAGGLFGNRITLRATAVALRLSPTAVFRVGSKLLTTSPTAPLMSLLSAVGVDLAGTSVGSYDGLANVKITPAGLLNALGLPVAADISVAELNQLLAATDVNLLNLLDATVRAADREDLLATNLGLLQRLQAELGISQFQVQLGSDPAISGNRGLFAAIQTPNNEAAPALGVGVNALDLVTAAVGVGTRDNGIDVDVNTAGVSGLNILTGLRVAARVIEPPSIGMGGVGTKAYTGQVRLHTDIDTSNGLTGILQVLGTRIKLPVILDAVAAEGTITAIDCDASPRTVTIDVKSSVANACIGKPSPTALWSDSEVCTTGVQDENLVSLLGLNLISGKVAQSALSVTETMTLAVGETKTTAPNTLPIGTTVSNLVAGVLNLIGNPASTPTALTATQAAALADKYLGMPALQPGSGRTDYTFGDLDRVRDRLDDDGVDWSRPAGIFSGTMLNQWFNKVLEIPATGGCYVNLSVPVVYARSCVRSTLITALQTSADQGALDALVTGLLGSVVQPLLSTILSPLLALLEPLLNGIGLLLSNLLSNLLGLDLGRTDITLDSITCGRGQLVI